MSNVRWEFIIGKINDQYILEAMESYELPQSAATSRTKKEYLFMQNMQKNRFSRFASLAAAVVLILTLGVTAYAAGAFDSIIAKMSGAYATPDETRDARYEAAAEVSNKEPDTIDLKQLLGNAITLEESFYSGEDLMLVYSLDTLTYPINYDFDTSDERYGSLELRESMTLDSFKAQLGVSNDDYAEICRKIEENGEVSFILTRIELGDHILLTDGTDVGPMTYMEFDGSVFLEPQNGLPENAKNRDQLDLVFTVNCRDICFKMDGESIYSYWSNPQRETVCFTIPRITE